MIHTAGAVIHAGHSLAVALAVAPAGHAARDQIEAALDQMRDSVFEGISDKDLATCMRVFAKLGQRVGSTMPVIPGLQGDDEHPSSTGS